MSHNITLFDAHFHIIDPAFPLVANEGYLPSPFTAEDYIRVTRHYDVTGGAVVSGSFQAFDQGYLVAALERLGPSFFGVANIPADMTPEALAALAETNVTAVRFNMKRGSGDMTRHIQRLSNHFFDTYGWHTEFYVDSQELKDLEPILRHIPAFSIDHLGLSADGLNDLYRWVEKGARIKATGFGRLDFNPVPVMQTIYSIDPGALMFGTDLPSTRAPIPFSDRDVQLVYDHFSEEAAARIFYKNARAWYGRGKYNSPE